MGNDENYSLTDYQKGFNQLKNFVKNIPKNKDIINQGYFVDYQKYNDFKKIFDSLFDKQQKSAIYNNQGQQEIDLKILESSKLYTENVDNLQKNLLNNKQYILINEALCQLICIKNREKGDNNLIHFFRDDNDLILCNSDGKKQYFRLKFKNSNIFNRDSLYYSLYSIKSLISSIFNGINAAQTPPNTIDVNYNKISQDIINFFLNENKISQFLIYPNSQRYSGFLVDESWVQKWKNYYNYNSIEAKYLKGKFVESQTPTMIPIIANKLKQKMINNGLENISSYILPNINQIPQGKSYMILDEKFLKSYINNQTYNLKPTNFIISQNKIKIENSSLIFMANKNCLNNNNLIISPSSNQNINNSENAQFLKHLLKYEYFKNEYYMPAQNFKNAYIVDYYIIKKLMDIYNSKPIFELHFKPKTEINYQYFETYYNIISKNISNDILKQPSAQEMNNLKNDMSNVLFIKTFNNQPNILYADNFVLIDQEFASFLSQKFNSNLKMCPIHYKVVDNKIFMVIQLKQLVIYQISNFINNESFMTEYILFPNYQSQVINNELLTLIAGYGYLYWLKMNSSITLNNGIQFSFIPINNNQLNKKQINNFAQNEIINNNIQSKNEKTKQRIATPNISPGIIPTKVNNNNLLKNSLNQKSSINKNIMTNSINHNFKINTENFINRSNTINSQLSKQTELSLSPSTYKSLSSSQINNNNIDSNEVKNLRDEVNKLKYKLSKKENQVKDLQDKLKKVMVVNFISTDYSVNCGIACLPTDTFADVEAKLYKIYDNLRNTNNNFTVGGHGVLRFQTIQENKIHDGDKIILYKIE